MLLPNSSKYNTKYKKKKKCAREVNIEKLTGEDEGRSGAKEAEEGGSFIAAESRRHFSDPNYFRIPTS